jgi:fucokinase
MRTPWHYLVLTASNSAQAMAYESQLHPRLARGPLARVSRVLVVPDQDGKRVGSGGSTIQCLLRILDDCGAAGSFAEALRALRELRILIVHAGGDSRRLPAYSPRGKIFVPLPGGETLFDRLTSNLLDLPGNPEGQMVIAAGDALISFDPSAADLSGRGLTALAGLAAPEEAARHGVFCADASGSVRYYLQKPALEEQISAGALDASGRSLLDVGVMGLSAHASTALLQAFCREGNGGLSFKPRYRDLVFEHGLDLYREICCALGTEATLDHYVATAHDSGSGWLSKDLAELFPVLKWLPFQVAVLNRHSFLHFGSTRQLITSGARLVQEDSGARPPEGLLLVDTAVEQGGSVVGRDSWVEGCRVRAPLALGGWNVIVGTDIAEPLQLAPRACLDVCRGRGRRGDLVWFIRCYGIEDSFKHPAGDGGTFNGLPLAEWLEAAGASAADVWDAGLPDSARTLWYARVFPAETQPGGYARWLWMHDPRHADEDQKRLFVEADRYSAAEVALAADLDHDYKMRESLRAAAPKERGLSQ